MSVGERRGKFGPYAYTAELGVLHIAADCAFTRWASVHEITGTSHLVYHLHALARDKFTIRRFLRAAEAAVGGCGPHALGIASYALHPSGRACLVTPYPGDLGGVTTLRQLVRTKGARLTPGEVVRATEHLIDALASGEEAGRPHGAFALDACVVDRAGRVAIELFGFPARWKKGESTNQWRGEQRAALATAVRELLEGRFASHVSSSQSSVPQPWQLWLALLESTTDVASWADLKARMPRGNGAVAPDPSVSVVRSFWGKIKQFAGGG